MYINLEEKKAQTEPMTEILVEPVIHKVDVIDEVHDPMLLTLFIKPTKKMNEIYDLFMSNDLSSITIYNEDKSMYAVLNGYDVIESFTFNTIENYYVFSLSKKGINGLRVQIDEQKTQLEKLIMEVSNIKDSVDKLVVSQTPNTM